VIDQLLREAAPHVLNVMLRRNRDFAAAEDAVQEALLAASQQWVKFGLPENPRAWLITVASRRLTDQFRSEAARRRREGDALGLEPAGAFVVPAPDEGVAAERDDTLALFFGCCHPSLSTSSAVALTLRAVGGLTTGEIARAFLVPEATMAQRISRAKQTIKASGVPFPARASRLEAVLHVLYLVFSEGYAASGGSPVHRVELADEAIRLARMLAADLPDDDDPEVSGLLALMLLTNARRAARTGPDGELVPLEEQDRSRWNRVEIQEGTALIEQALARGAVGPYQLQAAIAALHDEAASADATDWPQIAALYGLLVRMTGNPMARLSHVVAMSMVDGPAAGLALLDRLERDDRIAGHYRLEAVRGHLHDRAGNRSAAVTHYRAAASRTASIPERNYLLMKAGKLA